jgi:hypothetical protein
VLRIKHLLFVEGLTLAGARKRMHEEQAPAAPDASALDDLLSSDARERIRAVRQSLRELAAMLAAKPGQADLEFALEAPVAKPAPSRGNGKPAAKKAGKKK